MLDYFEYGFNDHKSSHTISYLLAPLIKILNTNNCRTILDVGCGNGSMAVTLMNLGYDVYGIDASYEGIEIAKHSYPNKFFLQNINSKVLPVELDNIIFDTIISTEVIEHLFDPKNYINFCKSVLTKNKYGLLILSTPYHGYLKNLTISILNRWDVHLNPLWDGGHIKLWSRKTLNKLLIENGFSNIKFYGCGRVPYLWKSMIITSEVHCNE
jgi:2-polyprenyl-3-methyl-5-hydroxy-6-metoxy-1,4-benzoquinol methylase